MELFPLAIHLWCLMSCLSKRWLLFLLWIKVRVCIFFYYNDSSDTVNLVGVESNCKVEIIDSLKIAVGNTLIARLDQQCIERSNDQMPGTKPSKNRNRNIINQVSKKLTTQLF